MRRTVVGTFHRGGRFTNSVRYPTPCCSTHGRGAAPSMVIRPDVGCRNPINSEIMVDFPAPFGPAIPTTSPRAISSVNSASASTRLRETRAV